MSKTVKQRIRFYSSKDKKFKYKIIETTEIKRLKKKCSKKLTKQKPLLKS